MPNAFIIEKIWTISDILYTTDNHFSIENFQWNSQKYMNFFFIEKIIFFFFLLSKYYVIENSKKIQFSSFMNFIKTLYEEKNAMSLIQSIDDLQLVYKMHTYSCLRLNIRQRQFCFKYNQYSILSWIITIQHRTHTRAHTQNKREKKKRPKFSTS